MAAPQETNSKPDIHEQLPPRAPAPEYHPAFADTDAEIVVSSSEGTLYRVHAYTLCTTSGLFKTLLSLPPPPGGHTAEPIAIHEPDAVVEPLLRIMCGLETSPWTSLYQVSDVLTLAQNWDAPGPIAFLRPALTSHKFLTANPLRVYALASHFGFRAETQLASSHTLSLNLFDPTNAEVLASMPATAALPLLRLHRSRRDGLRDLLDSPERFLAGNGQPFHCSACAITPLENRTWRALKHRVLRELDMCASGDALKEGMWSQGGMGGWAEAKACWAAVCVKVGCGAANYDRVATIKQIRTCLEGLPVAVEVEWLREDEDTK
ncbi:F-box domain-containing protein [Mycena venus]|uniref:F-box domain-containing protein n=1 Tax=Mycena venus TaxID=2733690 RepID=A0A8H6X6N7_9AGAR|nr:F-box domain-containing protein [Mycena venus]